MELLKDGKRDYIGCGRGDDEIVILGKRDQRDVLINCETVRHG